MTELLTLDFSEVEFFFKYNFFQDKMYYARHYNEMTKTTFGNYDCGLILLHHGSAAFDLINFIVLY